MKYFNQKSTCGMTLQQLRECLRLVNGALTSGLTLDEYLERKCSANRIMRLAKVFEVDLVQI